MHVIYDYGLWWLYVIYDSSLWWLHAISAFDLWWLCLSLPDVICLYMMICSRMLVWLVVQEANRIASIPYWWATNEVWFEVISIYFESNRNYLLGTGKHKMPDIWNMWLTVLSSCRVTCLVLAFKHKRPKDQKNKTRNKHHDSIPMVIKAFYGKLNQNLL